MMPFSKPVQLVALNGSARCPFHCWLVLIFLLGGALVTRGGDYLVNTWEVDDGLPESAVSEVAQTAEGYIWVGTLNSGLSRFDGVRFVNFDSANTPQLGGRGVRRLIADPGGVLWINGFGNYLASWRAGKFHAEYPGPAVITSLVEAATNRIIFATQEGQLLEGASKPDGSRTWAKIIPQGTGLNARFVADRLGGIWFRRMDRQLVRMVDGQEIPMSPVSDSQTTALAGDVQGNIAVGAADRLYAWNNGGFHDITPTNGEPDLAIVGIVSDGQGGWWVEANDHLRRCRDRQWIAEATDWNRRHLLWRRVHHEQPDSQGGLWFDYVGGGLIHVGGDGHFSSVTTRDGLPSNTVRTIFQDREGNLWASFEHSGLSRVRPRLFEAVGKSEGLADTVVTSVCEDRAGAIWIGSIGGTVSRFEQGHCTNFTLPQLGTHCEMALVYPDADGRVWIGTHGDGVFVHEAGSDTFQPVLSLNQVGVRVRGVLRARDGRLWVASQDGLFCQESNRLQQLLKPAFEDDYPTELAEGPDGTVWVGMNTGELLKADHGELTTFRPSNPTVHRRFSAVYPDADGTVWIGTLGAGLLRFKANEFASLTASNGLPTDTISQVIEDGSGHLWFGSSAGIFSVEKTRLNACFDGTAKTLAYRIYGRDNGLPTLGCAVEFQPTAWRDHTGRLWFATGKGVTYAQPHDTRINTEPPPVIIEEVRVDGNVQWTGTSVAGAQPVQLDIGPGRHQLEFSYTGLSFTAPDRVRFKYMLDGLDPGWIDASGTRTATYSAVPPGHYEFKVMARNSDGVWSAAAAQVAMSIRPHVWETWWFQGLGIVVLLAVVGGGVWSYEHRRTHRRLEQIERQQALERERVRVARDLHDELGAGLTEIGLLGALAKRTNTAPDRVREHLAHITGKAREMVTSLDEIVWSINPKNDSLVSLSKYFCEYVQQFLQLTPIRCRIEVADDLSDCPLTSEQRHHLLMAFKEALTNVVRHAQASEVRIGMAMANGDFIITVADDGRGFASASSAEGADGLLNLSRRMDQLAGRCDVQTGPGRGTTVKLIMPLPKTGDALNN